MNRLLLLLFLPVLPAQIVVIQPGDIVGDSRAVINSNFNWLASNMGPALGFSPPLFNTANVISCATAAGSQAGCLAASDWTAFNSKAPATSGVSVLKGNGSGGFSSVGASDIIGLFGGCSGTLVLSADGNCHSGASVVFQTNGMATAGQTTINYQNSATFNGLTVTVANPSAGNVQLGLSGTLNNAGLTYSSVTVTPPAWLTGGAVSLGSTLTVTATAGQTSHQVIGTCNNATTFGPCSLVIGDLPSGVVSTSGTPAAHQVAIFSGSAAATGVAVPASGTVLTGVASSDPVFTKDPILGVVGSTSGTLGLTNADSNYKVTLAASVVTGSDYSFTFPVSGGVSGYVLSTDGSGGTSWIPVISGGNVSNSGTPLVHQFGVWTDATHLKGLSTATIDDSGNVALGTSLVIGSPSLGSDVLAIGGTTTHYGSVTVNGGPLVINGNISTTAWTTSGVRIKGVPGTLTDTTSNGTVAAAYTDVLGGNTINATGGVVTFTNYYTMYAKDPVQGTATLTNKWSVGGDSLHVGTSNPVTVSTGGVLTATNAALTTPSVTTSINDAGTSGAATVGAAGHPFGSVYLGNAATNNIRLTGTSAAARVVTIPDIGTDTGATVALVPTTTTATYVMHGTATGGLGAWGAVVANDIAANAVTPGKMAVSATYRVCDIAFGDTSGSTLANTQLGPQSRVCYIPAAGTIVEVDVNADAGTPSIILGRNHAGAVSNLFTALSTASAGGIACSNTGGTVGLNGITTCSNTLSVSSLATGDYIEPVSGTASTAKFMVAHVIWTVN